MNQRKEPRLNINTPLELVNDTTNQSLGSLVNISDSGFLLSTSNPVPDGLVLRFRIVAGCDSPGIQVVRVVAESVWHTRGSSDLQFWNGFRIIRIESEQQQWSQCLQRESDNSS